MITYFNKIVLIVATILLILGLIIISIMIIKTLEGETFPPVVTDCPDYWNVTYNSGGDTICKDNHINSGYSTNQCRNYPTTKFNANGTSANDIICEKFKWAKECNIHWDGITNNPKACAHTTMYNNTTMYSNV
jgi:uncharacterized protein YxeA